MFFQIRQTSFYVTLYVCKVCCLKKPYNKTLINLDRLVITGKYQTSVFYVRKSLYGLGMYCQDLGMTFSTRSVSKNLEYSSCLVFAVCSTSYYSLICFYKVNAGVDRWIYPN